MNIDVAKVKAFNAKYGGITGSDSRGRAINGTNDGQFDLKELGFTSEAIDKAQKYFTDREKTVTKVLELVNKSTSTALKALVPLLTQMKEDCATELAAYDKDEEVANWYSADDNQIHRILSRLGDTASTVTGADARKDIMSVGNNDLDKLVTLANISGTTDSDKTITKDQVKGLIFQAVMNASTNGDKFKGALAADTSYTFDALNTRFKERLATAKADFSEDSETAHADTLRLEALGAMDQKKFVLAASADANGNALELNRDDAAAMLASDNSLTKAAYNKGLNGNLTVNAITGYIDNINTGGVRPGDLSVPDVVKRLKTITDFLAAVPELASGDLSAITKKVIDKFRIANVLVTYASQLKNSDGIITSNNIRNNFSDAQGNFVYPT